MVRFGCQWNYGCFSFLGLYFVDCPSPGWLTGLMLLLILIGGHVLHYFMLPQSGDYSGVVRLSQLIAYPLLLFLPQRFGFKNYPATVESSKQNVSSGGAPAQLPVKSTDLQVWKPLYELGNDASPDLFRQTIATSLCQVMGAEVCLLISPPDANGNLQVLGGYDRSHQQPTPTGVFETRQAPVITAAFHQGRALRLPASSTSPDVASLARFLNAERTGHLLAAPVPAPDGHLLVGVVLLTAASTERPWKVEHQYQLVELTRPLAYFLQRVEQVAALQSELAQTRQTLRFAQNQVANNLEEQKKLNDIVGLLRQKIDQSKDDTFNQSNEEIEQLKGELQMALQELASLRTANGLVIKTTQPVDLQQSGASGNLELIASQTQVLRQPLSLVSQYLDALLGGSVGLVENRQRRLLERMKVSLQRMSRSIDDLLHLVAIQVNQVQLEPVLDHLASVVKEVVDGTATMFTEKNMTLRVDQPQQSASLKVDRCVVKQILTDLLSEGCETAPEDSCLELRILFLPGEAHSNYLHLQLASPAIPTPDAWLPLDFSNSQAQQAPRVSAPEPQNISIEPLVDSLGGRVWIDQDPVRGSVIQVVLPVESTPPQPDRVGNDSGEGIA
jgi:signal transduction histidine kinase